MELICIASTEYKKKKFKELVDAYSPKSNIVSNCTRAFFVGGSICVIGEIIKKLIINMGVTTDNAPLVTSMILILTSVVLTSLGYYDVLGKFGGAGSSIPITGFANSVCAPAIEFKKEGYILGVGTKIFIICGPVILYGTTASVVIGAIYYIIKKIGE